jgi:hypothetical protein
MKTTLLSSVLTVIVLGVAACSSDEGSPNPAPVADASDAQNDRSSAVDAPADNVVAADAAAD